jgi:hydrogenase nickel incorporation protein HypA/HybF
MHELSIASAVLDIVQRHAGGRRVSRVELKVGHLRQVVPSALEFAFELVAEGSVAEGAELVMEEVPATVRCERCGRESTLTAFPARCAACGSLDAEVTGGEELLVDALELEDEIPDRDGRPTWQQQKQPA